MTRNTKRDVTVLLQAWSEGDQSALEELTPLIYAELRRLARSHMAREKSSPTLETGVLLNEAFLRLVHWKKARWQNRSHFYGLAAKIMRRVLVDHARSHRYQKRAAVSALSGWMPRSSCRANGAAILLLWARRWEIARNS